MKQKWATIGLSLALGLAFIATKSATAHAMWAANTWQTHYRYAYKVKVLKTTPLYKVTIGKADYLNKAHRHGNLRKGQIVHTKFSGNGQVYWWVTGGKYGKAKHGVPISNKYMYSANFKSAKSFKILATDKNRGY